MVESCVYLLHVESEQWAVDICRQLFTRGEAFLFSASLTYASLRSTRSSRDVLGRVKVLAAGMEAHIVDFKNESTQK